MARLKDIKKIVLAILEENHQARSNDNLLYLLVLRHFAKGRELGLDNMAVPQFLMLRSTLGLPCFESVRRARQKLQAEHPDLGACEAVQDFRAINETEYREFSQGGA